MNRFWPRILSFILLISSFLTEVRAQEGLNLKAYASPIRSIDPSDTNFSDLQGLKAAIGGARIVLLGEQTHGEGSTFLAKTRVIKFLHERLGFDVLAFESGFYDCARIWSNVRNGGQLSDEVIGSLFYMYASSKQMQPLFDYVQSGLGKAHSLVLAGFESQHSGVKAKTDLFVDFEAFLKRKDPSLIDSAWKLFSRISVSTFSSRGYRPGDEEKKIFFQKLQTLKQALKDDRPVTDSLMGASGFWYQVVCSIESQTTRYWQMTTGNEVSVRDRQMAENLIWLAEKAYPGKKIIVWAHNGHIAKDISSLGPVPPPGTDKAAAPSGMNQTATPPRAPSPGSADAFVPMGATIHRHFGAQAYCIGFSGSEGSYMDYVNSHIIVVAPKPVNSIEGSLAALGYNYAFLNYHHAPPALQQQQQATLADYMDMEGLWPDAFDGLFFIKNIFPVDRTGK